MLLCSHLLADVEDLCDRVAIMYGGKVRAEGTCDELLEQRHATILEAGDMPEAIVAEVRQVLDRHGISLARVEHPRRSLESLFLEVVEKARAEGIRTSGAAAGGPVAGFLADDTTPQPPAQPSGQGVDNGLIDSLTRR